MAGQQTIRVPMLQVYGGQDKASRPSTVPRREGSERALQDVVFEEGVHVCITCSKRARPLIAVGLPNTFERDS